LAQVVDVLVYAVLGDQAVNLHGPSAIKSVVNSPTTSRQP
jgi:hypothetical protein